MMITHDKNDGKKNGDRAHYKVLPLMQRPKSVAIYQKWLRQTKLQHFFSLAGVAIVTVAKGFPNDSFWCCNRFSPIATPRSVVATPCSVATHSIGNHRGCCNSYYCNTPGVARNTYCHVPKAWQQVHQQRQWVLQQTLLPRINSIAIDGPSIAMLSQRLLQVEPSIATINIWLLEVASLLQRSILVAIPSIATINIWLVEVASLLQH